MAVIIDGKEVSRITRIEIAKEVFDFKDKYGITPGLAVILVGEDPASCVYVRNKHKACLEVGINSYEIKYPETVSEEELIAKINELNASTSFSGLILLIILSSDICSGSGS